MSATDASQSSIEHPLAGQVALITGATEGIGRTLALAMRSAGAAVVVTGRTAEKGQRLTEEFGEERLRFVQADATSLADVQRAVTAAVGWHDRIDILVNNAGGSAGEFGYVHELSDEGWMRGFDLNLHSAFWATRATIPHMLERGYGRVVNMSSVEGKIATLPAISPYVVSKHALNGLTKAVAAEYGTDGITCNAVCPGLVELERDRPGGRAASEASGVSYNDFVKSFLQGTKTKQLTSLDDIVSATMMLVSPAAAGITGVLLSVDGGTSPW